jgi:hypothetical protein
VEYPSILGVVLGGLGKYENVVKGLIIVPVPDVSTEELLEFGIEFLEDERPNPRARLKTPTNYRKVLGYLRSMGVPTSFGLPMEKFVESDELFRLEVVDDFIQGERDSMPSATLIYIRSLVTFAYLSNLFGEARVSYVAVSQLRASVVGHIFRNINGPRINTSSAQVG